MKQLALFASLGELKNDAVFYSHKYYCYLMSYVKAKNAPNSILAGAPPRPRWGAYSAPPDSLAGFKGPASKDRVDHFERKFQVEGIISHHPR